MDILLIVDPAAPCFRIFFSTWTKQLNRKKGKNLKKKFFDVYSECLVKLLENVL